MESKPPTDPAFVEGEPAQALRASLVAAFQTGMVNANDPFEEPQGSCTVCRSSRLAWDALINSFSKESILRERFATLKASTLKSHDEVLELTEEYLRGWQPGSMDED